jgi:hypothetical protein
MITPFSAKRELRAKNLLTGSLKNRSIDNLETQKKSMKKSVVSRMSLRSDKDVETYLLKSRSDDNEKNEIL